MQSVNKIKVLIVDDEKLERVLIRNGYDWEKNGFEIEGEASGGQEALDFLEKNEVDIVLTDINMAGMDGLEFVRNAEALYPDYSTVYIIITGYRDFEYARQAVKLGVKDFLLKPIDFGEMESAVLKVKENLLKADEDAASGSVVLSQTVQKAIGVINDNLCNPLLSLTFVAEQIYTNPSYLSRVFKKEAMTSFNLYVLQKRIEKARILFDTTDLKLYEVSEMVGFEDSSYFSVCFKKIMGISVTDYKKGKNNQ